MSSTVASPGDGRRARRERSRAAVIDAVFSLIADGKVPPQVEEVAERSSVSVSSIFRMFDGLDDMRDQAFREFEVRYSHLFEFELGAEVELSERIERFVRTRVELCSAAGPLMSMARGRSLDHGRLAERVNAQRAQLARQTQRFLRSETMAMTPAAAANLVALVDVATSPEAFEALGATHARTRRQIEQTWRRAVEALVSEWCGPGVSKDSTGDPT